MAKQTDMLTPEEARRQARMYNEMASKLESKEQTIELGESKYKPTKKDISFSKAIINWSFIAFGIVGIAGSFLAQFDMTKFTNFLETFALIWAPLVIAVGGGRSFKNFINKKYQPSKSDDDEDNPPV
ncbi:MAG: hypothetical protein ACOCRO_03630 [Halanaerobiales bacterium]